MFKKNALITIFSPSSPIRLTLDNETLGHTIFFFWVSAWLQMFRVPHTCRHLISVYLHYIIEE